MPLLAWALATHFCPSPLTGAPATRASVAFAVALVVDLASGATTVRIYIQHCGCKRNGHEQGSQRYGLCGKRASGCMQGESDLFAFVEGREYNTQLR